MLQVNRLLGKQSVDLMTADIWQPGYRQQIRFRIGATNHVYRLFWDNLVSSIMMNNLSHPKVSRFWNRNSIFWVVLLIHEWYKYICQNISYLFGRFAFSERQFLYLMCIGGIFNRNSVVDSGAKEAGLNPPLPLTSLCDFGQATLPPFLGFPSHKQGQGQ